MTPRAPRRTGPMFDPGPVLAITAPHREEHGKPAVQRPSPLSSCFGPQAPHTYAPDVNDNDAVIGSAWHIQ